MTDAVPPKGPGALGRREARLAWGLLLPTIAIVAAVVVLPLLAIFWISFKPVGLADLRLPAPVVRESLRGEGEDLRLEYRLRNSSRDVPISGVTISDTVPEGLTIREADDRCEVNGGRILCDLGDLDAAGRDEVAILVTTEGDPDALGELAEASPPELTGTAPNILTNAEFTLENFARIFDGDEFWERACGWDQKTIRDEGPFLMGDPAITFILIRANRDLAAMAETLGEDGSAPAAWADEMEAALPWLWNADLQAYVARDVRTGRFASSISSGAALGLLAGVENAAMEAKLAALWDRVTYGIPSNDPAAPGFEPRRYWRGPTWPVVNALIALGLADAGRHADEARLRRETAALIRRGGFLEYFDSVDGTACGGDRFTWTAAIWLAWANREDT